MHDLGESTRPVSRKLVIAGALGTVVLAGIAAGGGSYLVTRNATSPAVRTAPTAPVVVPTVMVSTAATSPPTSAPTAITATAEPAPSAATSAQPVRPARTARATPSTKPVPATAPPLARTTEPSAPARATAPSPVCVPDSTWAARQERNRISREARRFDMNVQINMAINSGDLDEAARLQNDMQALEQQWAIDDQLDPEPVC